MRPICRSNVCAKVERKFFESWRDLFNLKVSIAQLIADDISYRSPFSRYSNVIIEF